MAELGAQGYAPATVVKAPVAVAEICIHVRGRTTFGPPKTKASRRSVPIPDYVVEELTEHVAAMKPDDLVFTSVDGHSPIRASNFHRRIWQPACVEAGFGKMVDADTKTGRSYEGLRPTIMPTSATRRSPSGSPAARHRRRSPLVRAIRLCRRCSTGTATSGPEARRRSTKPSTRWRGWPPSRSGRASHRKRFEQRLAATRWGYPSISVRACRIPTNWLTTDSTTDSTAATSFSACGRTESSITRAATSPRRAFNRSSPL